jgi:hypothetical protein
MASSNNVPETRAIADVQQNKLPAGRQSFSSDAEFQNYTNRFSWEKQQAEKRRTGG